MPIKELSIPSNDRIHTLHVVIWEPETDVKAVVQISHGMVEFIERYDGFAKYMNAKGILVVGNDHLGHGHTAGNDDDLGYFCENKKSATVVADLHSVTNIMKEKYPNVPYFLLGHSMGSFMARRYIMTYGEELTGAIISGTGFTPPPVLLAGKCTAGFFKLFRGDRYRSKVMTQIAFGAYNKRIPNAKSPNSWLTRDEAIVDWYDHNKYCTFMFTVNGYRTLFETIDFIQKKENYTKIPKKLPLLFIAGKEDPVGNYGEAVKQVYTCYRGLDMHDVNIKLYDEDRHEVFNELDKENVYNDVYSWVEAHLV